MQTLTYIYSYTSELVAIFILLHNTCTLSRYRQSYPCSLIFVYHMFQFLLLQFYKNFMLLFTHYFTIHREYLRRKFSVHFQIHSNAYACPNLILFLFYKTTVEGDILCLLPRSFINIIYIVVIKVCETTNFSCGFNLCCPFIGRIGWGPF